MNAPFNPAAAAPTAQRFVAAPLKLLIDGEWVDAKSGETFPVLDPATGEVFAHAAAGDAADIDLAVRAARRAFEEGPWSSMTPGERARLLLRLADALEANADELAVLESRDNGMPVMIARYGAVAMSAESLRYHAGWATKLGGETPPNSTKVFAFTVREPVGVIGQIVPWNMPLAMAVGKVAAALSVGCTVILKPAEQTPLSALRLGQLIQEVGIPPGVVNVVTGFGETAGAALVAHPDVDKIAFTGSTSVGKAIVHAATGNLKRVTLELGGKSPVIIFPDADLERATAAAANGIFFNTGQVCAAGSRLFVHKSIFDKVLDGVVAAAKKLKIGPGMDPSNQMGPVVSAEQLERVTGYIHAGAEKGAEVLSGDQTLSDSGYFVRPTVLANVNRDMSVYREEIFGPVLCAMPFDTDDLGKIAQLANDTSYGLSSSIWTRDITTAHRLIRKIRAGNVGVNGGGGIDFALPIGGYKQSGWGRENGRPGVEIYTELKTVSIGL
jgi:phenylacetaldehyde dehydrogenase